MSKICLLVVDIQKSAMAKNVYAAEHFIHAVVELIDGARAESIPVVHIQHDDGPGTELATGSLGWEFAEPVRPISGEEVIEKKSNSGFKETGLETSLRDRGIETLVICGLQTEYCINATVLSAKERDFNVVIPREGHTTWDNNDAEAGWLTEFYADRIWNGRYASVEPVQKILDSFAAKNEPSL